MALVRAYLLDAGVVLGRPRKYTDAQKAEALRLYSLVGPDKASTETHIPARTIRGWANEAALNPPEPVTASAKKLASAMIEAVNGETPNRAVIEEAALTVQQMTRLKRQNLAIDILDEAIATVAKMRSKRRMIAEAYVNDDGERIPAVYEGGEQAFFSLQDNVVERWYSEMSPASKLKLAQTLGHLMREFRLEAGEPTDRPEMTQRILDVVKDDHERDLLRRAIAKAIEDERKALLPGPGD